MATKPVLICLCLFLILLLHFALSQEPGICTSRFDYDYKILRKLHDLEVEIEAVKQTLHDRVAFMAELSHDLKSFTKGATVVFDHTILNNGSRYNPSNGVFVAKAPGLYVFHLVATSRPGSGNHIFLHVMKNNEQVNYLFLDKNVDFHHHRSVPTVLEIAAGDQVKVIIHGSDGTPTLAGCCFHTHFSGYSLTLK
ncbi:heavy metal-binding protein HIP-like [Mya arenaria]|uniref:heavy metal-binding protein HIP-like n=1 Tax=Mya arenaria TaxID=6604 RepID=UPI0022E36BB4|nr:heavy metal-binding protein HIP-like [Mya arenaria]